VDAPPHRPVPAVGIARSAVAGGGGQAPEIHRIDLFAADLRDIAVDVKEIVLVGKFFAGEQHRDADRGHQTNKGKLYPLFDLLVRQVAQHRKQPLMPEALDIVLGDVVDRLRAIAEDTTEPAIDRFAHIPFEIVATGALAEDRGAHPALKIIVPQPVEPVLAQ
jgi:hypothetical protein